MPRETISHYQILEKLGEGGMGAVYLAEDGRLGRQVAIKILSRSVVQDSSRLERFRREARALAALNHPNIVTIHSIEEVESELFLVMELMAGGTLADCIPSSGLPLDRFLELAIPLADALSSAHEQGIVHRDLKPGNIMLTQTGVPKILDFGLAKFEPLTEASLSTQVETEFLTEEGRILGTAPYMSPEQLKGKPVDGRSDIFSFGIVLYRMATGNRPFSGETSIDLASAILRDTPSPIDTVRKEMPHHLGRLIRQCLEKDPERRIQSAKDLRNALEDLKQETTTAHFVRTAALRPASKSRALWVGVAGAVVAAVLAAALWTLKDRARDQPTLLPEAQMLLDQGRSFELRGDTQEDLGAAENRYRRALELEPDSPYLAAHLASLLARIHERFPTAERPEEVSRLAAAALAEDPDQDLAHVALGRLSLIDGKGAQAEASARRAIEAAPSKFWGYTLLGQALVVQERAEEGLLQLRKGVEVAGSDIRARSALAKKLMDLGKTNEAAAEYEQVLAYAPDFANALNNLAIIYGRSGRDLDAIPLLKRRLALGDDESAAVNLGMIYLGQDRPEDAIEAFQRAYRINPDKALIAHSLGDAVVQTGDEAGARDWYEKALAGYDRELEAGGSRARGLGLRAVCAARLGRATEARDNIGEALELAPNHRYRLFNAAQVFALLEDREIAYRHIEAAVAAGYSRLEFQRDPAFATFRDEPEFRALLEAVPSSASRP